jgi:hypothetical protein
LGFLQGGGRSDRIYTRTHPDGIGTLRAAQRIPKDGLLLCEDGLAGFCANRPDILGWHEYLANPEGPEPDFVFLTLQRFVGRRGPAYEAMLRSGAYGLRDFDGNNLLLERGADTDRNPEALAARERARLTIRVANTAMHPGTGRDVPVAGALSARYWEGDGSRSPVLLSFGDRRTLAAGRWQAVLRVRAKEPKREVRGYWGRLQLFKEGAEVPLVDVEIDPVAGDKGAFRFQAVTFDLDERTAVEPRLIGGDARLWLDRLWFEPAPADQ